MPPRIYEPMTSMAELRTAELLLVTTLRLYALGWKMPVACDWRGGLAAAGLDEAEVENFVDLFDLVVIAHRRKFDVGWPHCQILSPDEGRFVQLIGLLQRHRTMDASAILSDWLRPTAVRLALPAADAIAHGLAHHGLIVPPRAPAGARGAAINLVQFGARLLH
jgi:hypothetical protein